MWDVVSPSTGMNHGGQNLHVRNSGEVSWFVQIVHASHFHHLAHYLIGDLVGQLHTAVTQTEHEIVIIQYI